MAALRGRVTPHELSRRAQLFLVYHRLFHDLVPAWANWQDRQNRWVEVDGEEYLTRALASGKGVFLISPHDSGFSKFVAPVLASRGYRVNRGGAGKSAAKRAARWGKTYPVNWRYINYDYTGSYWDHLAAMKRMRQAIANGEIVHISPLWCRHGDPNSRVTFGAQHFYLDPVWFRMIESCDAQVVPCLASLDLHRGLGIKLYPALGPTSESILPEWTRILSNYLEEQPESARFWKAYLRGEEKW